MEEELIQLRDRLQFERQGLTDKLKQIDADLESILRVIALVNKQQTQSGNIQLPLIEKCESKKLADLSFKEALNIIFKEKHGKVMTPKEITSLLQEGGFLTRSKDFANTVRSMLSGMRKRGEIRGTKAGESWLYGEE